MVEKPPDYLCVVYLQPHLSFVGLIALSKSLHVNMMNPAIVFPAINPVDLRNKLCAGDKRASTSNQLLS